MELAGGIVEVDTAGWAESLGNSSDRIFDGFYDDCRAMSSLKVAECYRGQSWMTISTLIYLIDPKSL